MRVLLSTIGSRGEVQPVVALALRLRALGQQVRVCAPPDFGHMVGGYALPFVPVGPEVRTPFGGVGAAVATAVVPVTPAPSPSIPIVKLIPTIVVISFLMQTDARPGPWSPRRPLLVGAATSRQPTGCILEGAMSGQGEIFTVKGPHRARSCQGLAGGTCHVP
ncbi:glycosyltransferase [Nonomuraea sp. NPDC049784]|uniref:glycosyltransferase n=1 Tax=Nonomuraea sp. NPDC049784 TaxID=3154361 RepID=UPI0033DC034A